MAASGGYLLTLGGSAYYLPVSLALVACGIMLLIGRAGLAARLYAVVLIVTIPWAFWMILVAIAFAARAPDPADPIYQTGFTTLAKSGMSAPADDANGDWLHYGRDSGGKRYSPLAHITPANVGQLEDARRFQLGDTNGLQTTPIKVGRTLYVCSAYNDVVALDAEIGSQRWRYNANIVKEDVPYNVCRGVSHTRLSDDDGLCLERILTNATDAKLIALDARTGRLCDGFGDGRDRVLADRAERGAGGLLRGNIGADDRRQQGGDGRLGQRWPVLG